LEDRPIQFVTVISQLAVSDANYLRHDEVVVSKFRKEVARSWITLQVPGFPPFSIFLRFTRMVIQKTTSTDIPIEERNPGLKTSALIYPKWIIEMPRLFSKGNVEEKNFIGQGCHPIIPHRKVRS
jgi:hypothetical protein